MSKGHILVGGLLGLGLVYMLIHKSVGGVSPVAGAATGTASSQPSTQYPFTVPQAARADNNPAVNNQPYAQKAPTTGGVLGTGITTSQVASAAQSVASVFSNLFSSSTGDTSTTADVASANDAVGASNAGGSGDSSFFDGTYDDSSNFGVTGSDD